MLDIVVNGQRIYIEQGTSIQVEFNNNMFSTDGIEGDVAYTFSIPAAHNDIIFNSARYVYVQRRRKYACSILLADTPIGNGDLYVTKATKDTYSCELTVNSFPDGWRGAKLRENDYDADIIISDSYANHESNWINFIKSTLLDSSIVKFPLFIDEEYYDDNEDFGMWEGTKNKPVNDINDFARKACFVNRIVYAVVNGERRPISTPYLDNHGSYPEVAGGPWKIFPQEFPLGESVEKNQVSLAPAIRLLYLLQKVVENSGYTISGNFVTGNDMQTLFYQSLHSMDGNIHDNYLMHDSRCSGKLAENVSSLEPVPGRTLIPFYATEDPYSLFDNSDHSYRIEQEGVYHFTFNIQFYATGEEIYITTIGGNYAYGCCMFVMREANSALQFPIPCEVGTDDIWHASAGIESFLAMATGTYIHGYDFGFTPPEDWTAGGVCTVCIDFTHTFTHSDIGKEIVFEYMFVEQVCNTPGAATEATIGNNVIPMRVDADFTVAIDDIAAYNLNIHTNKLVWKDHVPDMTNSEFLNALKKTFGLSVFINSVTKEIELSYCADLMNARQLDLTLYNLTDETSIGLGEQKNYSFVITPVQSEGYSVRKRIDDVEYMNQLPSARDNQGKIALVQHLNELYKSSKEETETGNGWSHNWVRFSGNDTKLLIEADGTDDETEVKSDARVPSVDFIMSVPPLNVTQYVGTGDNTPHDITDEEKAGFKSIHFADISQRCISFINESDADEESDGFPLILLHNLGDDTLPPYTDVTFNDTTYIARNYLFGPLYYHHFSPVCYDNNNSRVSGKDLTSTGDSSIGEICVKPWLKILGDYEQLTYRFLFPAAKLLEVIQLFRPQQQQPSEQIRWIFVENVKVLPIRMTFEVVEGKEQILAEIECAKPVV